MAYTRHGHFISGTPIGTEKAPERVPNCGRRSSSSPWCKGCREDAIEALSTIDSPNKIR